MQVTTWKIATLVLICLGGFAGLTHLAWTPAPRIPIDAGKADFASEAELNVPKNQDWKPNEPGKDAYGDPLPEGALNRLGTVRFRSGAGVYFFSYSADGKTIVYGSGGGIDHAVYFADARTGKILSTLVLKRMEMPLRAALSPNGKWLALAYGHIHKSDVGAVVVFDTATGKEFRRIECGGMAGGLAISPDSKVIVTVNFERQMHAWNTETGEKVHEFKEVAGRAGEPIFSADGKWLAFSSFLEKRNEQVFLCDTTTWSKVRAMDSENSFRSCSALAFSPDGKLLVGGYHHGEIDFWETESGKRIDTAIAVRYAGVTSLSFSSDGKWLATAGNHKTIFDVATRKIRHGSNQFQGTYLVAFSPPSVTPSVLVSNMINSSALRFWNPDTGEEIPQPGDAPTAPAQFVRFLSDGKDLSISNAEGGYRLWDSHTGRQLAKVSTGDKYIWKAVASPDGKLLAISHWRGQPGDDKDIHLFDVLTGKELRRFTPNSIGCYPISFMPTGRHLAVGEMVMEAGEGARSRIALWDTATGKVSGHIDMPKELPEGGGGPAAISQDGKSLAIVGKVSLPRPEPSPFDIDPGGVIPPSGSYHAIVDLPTGTLRWRSQIVTSGVPTDSIALSPDGKILAQGRPGEILLSDAATGALLRVLIVPTKNVRPGIRQAGALAFTPDGTKLIAGDDNTDVIVWDVATGKELQHFTGHRGRIFSIAVSPDNKMFATASEDSTVLLWILEAPSKDGTAGQR